MTPRWIPTTGEVHDEFVMAQAKFKGVNIRFASDKFKAWIDGRDAKLVQATEQRIIALLETVDDSNLWRQVAHSPDSYEGFNISDLIALIKGENK
jgi:hypothetical protein